MNVYTTFANIGSLGLTEFIPFLVLFILLVSLLKYLPGKPWIIFIAIVGQVFGLVTANFIPGIKPKLLIDVYPEMKNPSLVDFSYMSNDKISFMVVIVGALKVSFVAVLETLISARIAD
jgi:hypothetical protein